MALKDLKVVFTGPAGTGKSTAVKILSDEHAIDTEEVIRQMEKCNTNQSSSSMDYGVMQLDDAEYLHLYGTTSQVSYGFMWEILTQEALGVVLLIDNSKNEPLSDLYFFLESFRNIDLDTPISIGITHMEKKKTPTIDDYQRKVLSWGWSSIPIMEVDARDKEDMSILVQCLLCSHYLIATEHMNG